MKSLPNVPIVGALYVNLKHSENGAKVTEDSKAGHMTQQENIWIFLCDPCVLCV
jgi:hypothetical protein